MADQESQEKSNATEQQKKGFWNKAEQISRVYHNIMDGSFKLLLIIGVIVVLIFGAGVYYKTTSGINVAKNWGCEYINPFCDTEAETAKKLEKQKAKEAREVAKKAAAADVSEEPGIFSRAWGGVKGWFGGDEAKP
mgnify:FL=1